MTFATTLGSIDPREAQTHNGSATVRFSAGTQSGEATITALSGGASSPEETEPLKIRVGAAAVGRISLTANPATLPSQGGTSEVIASVFDVSGNPLSGAPVSFSVDSESAGSAEISPSLVTTDSHGQARTRVTTTNDVTVSATVGGIGGDNGGTATATFTIRVNPIPVLTINADPVDPAIDEAVKFTLTPGTGQTIRGVTIRFGDGKSASLGNVSAATVVSHVYTNDGTFTVKASGTDNRGESVSSSIVVTVVEGVNPPVVVEADGDLTVGGIVTFTITGVGTTTGIERVRWDFGDGNTAVTTGLQTSHVYGSPGIKTVTVRVETTDGGTGRGQAQIDILP